MEVLEAHVAINSGLLLDLSVQQLVDCVQNPYNCGGTGGCSGSIPQLGFDYIAFYGLQGSTKWPYVAKENVCESHGKSDVTVDGYKRLPKNDYWAVKFHLVKYGC